MSEARNTIDYDGYTGRKAWLWAGFKAKKDLTRKEYYAGYDRNKLTKLALEKERDEFEKWYREYEGE